MSAPFMQLYVADYLGDTRHLTTEQHGAYLLLLMTMWRAEGVLPDDDRKLARIAGCTASRWAKIKDDVLAFFDACEGGLTNKRLKFELEKASEKSIKRAEAGTRGGEAKSRKTNKPDVANASGLPKHSSEPDIRTEANASVDIPTAKRGPTKVEIARGFAAFWAAYPKRVGKDAAAKSFAKAMARIDDADPLAVILAGIVRALPGWDDPQFIPHPATWLNQGRWADEEPAKPTPQRSPHVHRPDRHTAQLDHLAAISRAMGDVDHGGPGDRDCGPPADHGGGMRRLDTAA